MRKSFKIAVFIFLLILIFALGFHFYLTSKIEAKLANLPKQINLTYSNYSFNSLFGNLVLNDLVLKINDTTTGETNIYITSKDFQLEGLSYLKLIDNEIDIDLVSFNTPNIQLYKHQSNLISKTEKLTTKKSPLINIRTFTVNNGHFTLNKNEKIEFNLKKIQSSLSNVLIDLNTGNFPFSYTDIDISSEDLTCNVGDFEVLTSKKLVVTKDEIELEFVNFKTKYSKTELNRYISKERDYLDVDIALVSLNNYNIDLDKVKRSVKIKTIDINKLEADIYRNKLVADDLSTKKMYSEMLRNLSFDLEIDEVSINKSLIIYEEKVKKHTKAGKLYFKDLNAKMVNIGNTSFNNKPIEIKANTIFMKSTHLNLDWQFNVMDKNDAFTFKAAFGKLPAKDLSVFVKPNLSIGLKGVLNQTFLNIDGNRNTSIVNFRTKYDNFKVDVLNNKTGKTRKLLTSVINLLIPKNSKNNASSFRESQVIGVKRDATKSVFNFIWLNAKHGLLKAITGNGKK